MFRIEKSFTFQASHQLPHFDGKERHLHGHSWTMTIVVEGNSLIPDGPNKGMLLDHEHLDKLANRMVGEYLDYTHLNESTGILSPTPEALAEWVYNRLSPPIGMVGNGVTLSEVTVRDTSYSSYTYLPKHHIVEGNGQVRHGKPSKVPLMSQGDRKGASR